VRGELRILFELSRGTLTTLLESIGKFLEEMMAKMSLRGSIRSNQVQNYEKNVIGRE
jgi:hypothetical protein